VKIAVLSIGDELMYGEIVDTNFAYIAARLYDSGLPAGLHLTVGDEEGAIAAALRDLAAGHDAVIVTGGLGPTRDDRTGAAAAVAFGRPVSLDPAALVHIKRVAGRLGGDIPPANEKQALIPEGGTLIPNPSGTACGFILRQDGCRLFFLPGVPREMAPMLAETVLPSLLAGSTEKGVCLTTVLKVFGPSEAELDTLLADLAPPAAGVTVAFCVEFPEIHVKLRAVGESAAAAAPRLAGAAGRARALLGESIFAEDGDTMDTVVARLLRKRGLTLSLAESCTGGLVAKRLTDIPGSSAYFLEGAVTYADAAKTRILGVPPGLLEEKGAVSAEVAVAMASGMREHSGSDITLAVTGIAGPDGGSEEKPVGTVFIALATPAGCATKEYRFSGAREEIRTVTAFTALEWLRRHLLSP
jgi:nicotinamide-nucleotide amidase